jgi:hypothetical protein
MASRFQSAAAFLARPLWSGRAWRCAAVLLIAGLHSVAPAQSDALLGTWQLVHDVERPGYTDDFMDFESQGRAVLRSSKGTYARCTYQADPKGVNLQCPVKGTTKGLYLRWAEGRRSLVNPLGDVYQRATR